MKIKVGDLVAHYFSDDYARVNETFPIVFVDGEGEESEFQGLKLSDGKVIRQDQVIRHWVSTGV